MKDKRFLPTTEVDRKDLRGILNERVTSGQKAEIKKAVKKMVKEYGETLRLLGAD